MKILLVTFLVSFSLFANNVEYFDDEVAMDRLAEALKLKNDSAIYAGFNEDGYNCFVNVRKDTDKVYLSLGPLQFVSYFLKDNHSFYGRRENVHFHFNYLINDVYSWGFINGQFADSYDLEVRWISKNQRQLKLKKVRLDDLMSRLVFKADCTVEI